jgi:hypothetical protein
MSKANKFPAGREFSRNFSIRDISGRNELTLLNLFNHLTVIPWFLWSRVLCAEAGNSREFAVHKLLSALAKLFVAAIEVFQITFVIAFEVC